jgi:TonB-linked SusC/RagA family outer membrane protein
VLNVAVSDRNNKSNNTFTEAYRQAPSVPVKNADGTYGFISALSVANPVATLELGNELAGTQRYQGNIYGEVTLLKGLTFRSQWGFDKTVGDSIEYKPVYSYNIFNHPVSELFDLEHQRFYWVWDNILSYAQQFGDHSFSLMAGHTAEKDKGKRVQMRATNVPPDKNLWYIDQGDPSVAFVPAGTAAFLLQRRSYFSRLTYSYQDKYNINGVLRRDGSSAFPDNRQWGTFYSIAGSWLLSRENFMKGISWIDYLKLRGGYAHLGNDGISRIVTNELSQLLSITQTNPYAFPGGLLNGITFDQVKDAQASWEATKSVDAGIEFGLIGGRLTGELSFYNKLTNAYIRVPAPPFVDADGILSPSADVRNKGIEAALGWNDSRNKNFTYRFSVNATFNRNKVEKIRGGIDLAEGGLGNGEVTTYTVEGQTIGSFWVYQVEGIYQNQADIERTPHFVGALPGDFQYADINSDGSLDTRDRIFVGAYQPKFYYGFSGGITWKQLDFSFDCYGNHGNKVYNGKKAVRFGNDNIEAARSTRWTPTNTNTTEPRASNNIPPPSTYYIESGSFLRVNNITLGYNLPASLTGRAFMSNARIYVTAQNPIIIKEFSGFSPELPGTNALNSGIELGVYPTVATYMIGININFK